MSTTATSFAAAGAMALCGITAAAQQPAASLPDDHDIVQRFLTSGEPSPTAYQAFRRPEARHERFNADGRLEVCTELTPDSGFHYRVLAEGGSGLIRGRVLEKALESGREAWASGEIDRSTLGTGNYEFEDTGSTDGGLRRVTLEPRRKSRMLVEGAMFLEPLDADRVRVEGRLAKGPSFWTPRVDVIRRHERIAGVRVRVALESVAHVRMVGRSSCRMGYHDLRVNVCDLDGERARCATVDAGTPSSFTPVLASGERRGSHVG
jgi:hypothetical protein